MDEVSEAEYHLKVVPDSGSLSTSVYEYKPVNRLSLLSEPDTTTLEAIGGLFEVDKFGLTFLRYGYPSFISLDIAQTLLKSHPAFVKVDSVFI